MSTSRIAVALLAATLWNAGCDADAPADLECSEQSDFEHCTAEQLEDLAVDLAGKNDTVLTYDSGYANVVLVVLKVGSVELTRTDERMPGFSISGFGDGDDGGTLVLDTELFDGDGEPVSVQLNWELSGQAGDSRFLGLWPLGLQWSPTALRSAFADPILTVGGDTVVLSGLHGLSESGELNNLENENFAVMYAALFVLPRVNEGDSFAYAEVATTTLPNSSKSAVLDPVLDKRARVSETLGLGEGNGRGVVVPSRDDESVVLFEDVVGAGLADVKRQVVLLHDASGAELLGLRDVFIPR